MSLRDELKNAEETLADALDDTSALGAEDIEDLRANVRFLRRVKATREEQHATYLDCGPSAWDDR